MVPTSRISPVIASNTSARRHGYTLIELLVVLLISSLLIATALPIAAKVLEDSKVREASRQLNAFFAQAKTRAAATGRPCGLWLVPAAAGTSFQCTELYIAEVSAPYGGCYLSSRAWVDSTTRALTFPASLTVLETDTLLGLIDDGEIFFIRFDHKGDYFQAQRSGSVLTVGASALNTTQPPLLDSSTATADPGKPFQILRSPRRTAMSREMPAGTAIDLLYCGGGKSGNEFSVINAPTPPSPTPPGMALVMFSPSGAVQSVWLNGSFRAASGTVHFLVGRIEKTGSTDPSAELCNLEDPTSLWVSVGRQTGIVTTSENMPDGDDTTNTTLANARTYATNREQMGGR